ncbi:MAG TPA: TIGR03085 family metal-binding protein [Acidimicrobiia bacterium]|nr:TIGR03085 family metal-binding protein [Acidimicrobiia bacterium]
MSISSLARSERLDMCDLMQDVGPDAPTLNEGWDVLDLAAHVVAREHDLWATPGIVLGGPFAAAMQLAMKRRRRQGLERLVDVIRRGAPIWWRAVPSGARLSEYYIHHEDVRRANGGRPRADRPDLDEGLARLVRASGNYMLRGVDVGVDVVWQGGVLYRHGDEPRAVLTGPPGELLLYLSGRRSAAEVALTGDETAAERLRAAELGI